MRLLKWISWILSGLIVLALLGITVIVWVVDPNSFKSRIETEVQAATGRDFRLTEDIQLGFFPWLALRAGTGQLANPPDFPDEPLVKWQRAKLGARLLPLLRGELVIDRVTLEGADLRLVRRADGLGNWEGIGGEPAAPGAGTRRVTVAGVAITHGRISFVDEAAPRRVEVEDFNLTTDEIAPDRPFTDTRMTGVLHLAGFAPAGVAFSFEVPKLVLSQDYSVLEAESFSIGFGGLEVRGGVQGTLGDSPRLAGAIETNTFDARALLGAVGVEAPRTTDPAALSRVAIATRWRFDAGAVSADGLALTVDATHLAGSFSRAAGEDPVAEFRLRGDILDLGRYLPPTDPASEPFVFPAAMLKELKFRGALELEQASMGDVHMKGVTLRLVLDEQGLHAPVPAAPANTGTAAP